jgi:hypothetical protein
MTSAILSNDEIIMIFEIFEISKRNHSNYDRVNDLVKSGKLIASVV